MKRITLFLTALLFLGFAPAKPATDFSTDYVVVVMDASGSMSESMVGGMKMDVAKKALQNVLPGLPANTQIGVLVFSAGNLDNDWVYPFGPLDQDKLTKAIQLPEPDGMTPLGDYLKTAADTLLSIRSKRYNYGDRYRILVVTDGNAQDMEKVERFAPEILGKGIFLDVIGVDMEEEHVLAKESRSTYRNAANPDELVTAVSTVFAEKIPANVNPKEVKEMMKALPDSVVLGIVQALGRPNNMPIGFEPEVDVSTPKTPEQVAEEKQKLLLIGILGLAVIVLLIILISVARRFS